MSKGQQTSECYHSWSVWDKASDKEIIKTVVGGGQTRDPGISWISTRISFCLLPYLCTHTHTHTHTHHVDERLGTCCWLSHQAGRKGRLQHNSHSSLLENALLLHLHWLSVWNLSHRASSLVRRAHSVTSGTQNNSQCTCRLSVHVGMSVLNGWPRSQALYISVLYEKVRVPGDYKDCLGGMWREFLWSNI